MTFPVTLEVKVNPLSETLAEKSFKRRPFLIGGINHCGTLTAFAVGVVLVDPVCPAVAA